MRPIVCLALCATCVVAPARALAQVVSTAPLSTSLGTPDGVAIGPDGDVYVADFGGGQGTRVLRVDARGRVSTFADGFKAPDGLAFDAAGVLHVSSFNGGTIHRVLPDGKVSLFASGLDHPSGLAFDPAGNLYVANFGNFNGTTVSRITPDGVVGEFARGFSAPLGMAFGPDGLLYVGNFNTGTIHRVSPDGAVVVFAQVPNAPLSQLQYLAFDARGTLLAPSLGRNRVYAIDRRGAVREYAGTGIGGYADGAAASARFHHPNSIAIRGDTVWITEFQSGRLRRIQPGQGPAIAPLPRARFNPARLANDSATYLISQVAQHRTDSLGTLTMTRVIAGDSIVLAQAWNVGALQNRDTLVVDASSLRPITRRSGPASRRTETRYAPARVIAGRDTMGIDHPAPWFEGAGLELVLAALEHDAATTVSVPFFVAGQRGVVPGEVQVPGDDSGLVTLAYPNVKVSLRVSGEGRRVLFMEQHTGARLLRFMRRPDA